MSDGRVTYAGGPIFDGTTLHSDMAVRFGDGVFQKLVPAREAHGDPNLIDLGGDILSPGYVDLQVNGGDGVMLNDAPGVETLARISAAHRRLGVTGLLPTLITDTPEKTAATIQAAKNAIARGIPGILGLHLEGPHLSVAKKGAHDANLVRPMEDADLRLLLDAANALPVLKVTIAPENVTLAQTEAMAGAGILVSLGHTAARFDTCMAYARAGARCVTHLFNAMSQLDSREPGLVGAALANGGLSAGLIADAIHVHPAAMAAAWAAKQGPGKLFLVSDAMAVAGTEAREFQLEGRRISRRDGRLTLDDGTLAGADLDLTTAIRVLVRDMGVPLAEALAAATRVPAELIGQSAILSPGQTAEDAVIRIAADLVGAATL